MAGERVPVVLNDGRQGTIDAADVDSLPDGARVLSSQEVAEAAVQARYDKLPLAAKALGVANTVAGAVIPFGAGSFASGSDPNAPPTIAAAGQGFRHGASVGAFDAGQRVLLDKFGKPGAGDQFAEQQDQQAEASPYAYAAGNMGGMVAATTAGMGGDPVGAIGAAGGVAEAGVERVLGGLAAKGALGRAATTAAGMAVRGAIEGGAYAGAEQATSNVLHDQALGEKIYASMGHGALAGGALGGLVGFGGSLAASGARAAKDGLLSSLARTGEEASTALANGGRSVETALVNGGKTIERAALDAGQSVEDFSRKSAADAITQGGAAVKSAAKSTFGEALADPTAAAVKMANEQAWNAVGRGNGLQTTRFAKQAARFGGTDELGEIAIRHGLIDMGPAEATPAAAAWQAAKSGTAADIAPRAAAARELVGKKIGEMTEASGAMVGTSDIRAAFREARAPYAKIAGRGAEVAKLNAYEDELLYKLGGHQALEGGNVPVRVQDLLEQRKGLDDIIYGETKTLDPNGRVQILRNARGGLEDLIATKLDEASGLIPGEQRDAYQALKRDYHGLSILTDLAEDSAARASKGASLGLGEKLALATSVASGHILGGPMLAVGGKVLKERGSAAAAAYLSRHAALGTFDNLVAKYDAKIASSAANVLKAEGDGVMPRARPRTFKASPKEQADSREQSRAQAAETLQRATGIVKWVGDYNASPDRFADQIAEAAATVGRTAGSKAASDYTATTMQAIRFIAGHIPIRERRDPLDPRSTPPLTQDEAQTIVRATRYAIKPETVFEDFGRGVITPEGLRAAKTLAPESLARFQDMLLDHVTDHMLRNQRLTWSQRLQLDKLGIESIRPADVRRLQANFMQAPPDAGPNPAGTGPSGGAPPPLDMKIQQTGFDSIEARHTTS